MASPAASGLASELESQANFSSLLRYAQCWEDADILLDALEISPGDTCLSISSAGENSLSMLSRGPARVVAIDLNPAQLAALELRVAAFRELTHGELLELIGSRGSTRRDALYQRCRPLLSGNARAFWDARSSSVAKGIGADGKFERYFATFRRWVLPLVHRRPTVMALLEPRSRAERETFYAERWDTARWRLLFRAFFSETMLGRLGRDPSLFRYASGSVSDHLRGRVRHALVELDPSENPYLGWILTGEHPHALPHALRPENFEAIREHLDRLVWHCTTIEALTADTLGASLDAANLSDIFEYLAPDHARGLFEHLAGLAAPGARLAYWNMIVPRRGAELCPKTLTALPELSARLFAQDKAFFYRDFIVEEVA